MADFLTACSADQIRLAPDKCACCFDLQIDSDRNALTPVVFLFATGWNFTIFNLVLCAVLNVCRVLKDQVMQLNAPIRGIAPLRAAVRKIQASPEQLTPVHADYLLLCLLAKQYKAGLSVLEDDIFEVDQPKDLFLYCYYGSQSKLSHALFMVLEPMWLFLTSLPTVAEG